jgi:hypothetical protein
LSEPKVYEFKKADVRIEVFRYDTKITITQGLGEDPITILVSQNMCRPQQTSQRAYSGCL